LKIKEGATDFDEVMIEAAVKFYVENGATYFDDARCIAAKYSHTT